MALLAQHCNIAAVTLGEEGCLAQQQGEFLQQGLNEMMPGTMSFAL